MGSVDRWTTYDALKQDVCRWASVDKRDGSPALVTRGLGQWSVDLSGDCTRPFERYAFARASMPGSDGRRRLSVSYSHPCRRRWCEACMQMKARLWMARAAVEYRKSARTWMATFTMSPQYHALLDMKALPTVTETVSRSEARCRVFGAEIRKWFRRMHGEMPRGRSSYLAVAELHHSAKTSATMLGRPHFHMLLHEYEVGALIADTDCEFADEAGNDGPRTVYRVKDDGRPRLLWPFGHTKFILCYSEQSAVYVCKYLSKSVDPTGRVRASPGYGENLQVGDLELSTPPLKECEGA